MVCLSRTIRLRLNFVTSRLCGTTATQRPSTPFCQNAPALTAESVQALARSLTTTRAIISLFSLPELTEMFQFSPLPSINYVFIYRYPASRMGCPIRKSPGQSVFATHRGLSQLTTSFIGIQCQGIHHILSFTSYNKVHLDEIMCFIIRTICQRTNIYNVLGKLR